METHISNQIETEDNEGWNYVCSKKEIDKEKIRNKKNLQKIRDTKLWYNEYSWQHKVLTNAYKYEDGRTVLNKFNLEHLNEKYINANNNFEKNNIFKNLMKVVTKDIWSEEKKNFYTSDGSNVKNDKKLEMEENECKVEVEEKVEETKKTYDYATMSLVKDNKSFASLFKN